MTQNALDHSLAAVPFTTDAEYEGMIDYFLNADPAYLRGMGVNPTKLRTRDEWLAYVRGDRVLPDAEKDRAYVGWYCDGALVGHSSINAIVWGSHANIHLHLWRADLRRAGLGMHFFRASANYFMGRFQLQRLLCEPLAANPAPNRVLTKLGFRFIERHRAPAGPYSDEQDMNRYEIDHLLV